MKNRQPIYVTKTFLPPKESYDTYLEQIWQSYQLTNNGPLSKEFEKQVCSYLDLDDSKFRFVANGTLALQLALQALNINDGEVITTPFSYVATTSAVLWERCQPIFVDIDPHTLNIDPQKIEAAITKNTRAIMPVHVFGNPCDMHAIQEIADRHRLKVIYDAAHAFGATYKDKSLLDYGDVSVCSFHATKPFHTIEGGAIYAKDNAVIEKVELLKRFGHTGDEHLMLGINAKANEFQAAMGLCNLKYIDDVIKNRKRLVEVYDSYLTDTVQRPGLSPEASYNYAYYPIILNNEVELQKITKDLTTRNIFARRYFYPSLNTLPYIGDYQPCPVSEDIASRILCLPLFDSLEKSIIEEVCEVITTCVKQ